MSYSRFQTLSGSPASLYCICLFHRPFWNCLLSSSNWGWDCHRVNQIWWGRLAASWMGWSFFGWLELRGPESVAAWFWPYWGLAIWSNSSHLRRLIRSQKVSCWHSSDARSAFSHVNLILFWTHLIPALVIQSWLSRHIRLHCCAHSPPISPACVPCDMAFPQKPNLLLISWSSCRP